MVARENSGFSVDASVRITLIDRDVPSYFQSLEHLLRYCARPPFALERLSVRHGEDGRFARVKLTPDTPRRTARTPARLAGPWPADRAIFQGRIDELPDIDIHSL